MANAVSANKRGNFIVLLIIFTLYGQPIWDSPSTKQELKHIVHQTKASHHKYQKFVFEKVQQRYEKS